MVVKRIKFQKVLSIILAILMVLPTASVLSFAEGGNVVEEGACGAYSTYKLYENGLLTISGSASVNSYAFYQRTDIKALEVGDKITSFGPHAFNGCSELKTITLGDNVRTIGEKAFYGVPVETLELPDSVTTIASQAFADSSLKNLTLGDGIRNVNWNIVSGCPLENLTVYSYRLDLDANIPENVTLHAYHDSYAMDYAAQMGLKREALDEHEFEEIYTSDSTCGKDGFTVEACSCGEYKSETIPATEHIDSDSDNVCDNCGKYLGVVCSHDYDITVTKPTCTEDGVAHMVCRLCLDEQDVVLDATGHEYKYCDEGQMCAYCGEAYNYDPVQIGYPIRTDSCGPNATYTIYSTGELMITGSGPIESGSLLALGSMANKIIISGQITEIGNNCFDYFNYVTDVEILSSKLKRIGNEAFISCYELKSINLPSSVEEIGNGAFSGDRNLVSINFPSGLKTIGDSAFNGCRNLNTKNIKLDNVSSIGKDAFKDCSSIESIRIEKTDCTISTGAIPQSITIVGHKDSTAKKYALANGNKFDQIEAEEGTCGEAQYILYNDGTLYIYGSGEAGYFRNDLRIKKVVVEEGVTALSKLCFSGCTNIKEVKLSSTITKIGDNAFEYCSFDNLVIPDSVKEIGKYALKGATLNKLVIGAGLLEADAKTFQYAEIKVLEVKNTHFDPSVGSFRDSVIYGPHSSAAYKYALDWDNEFHFNDKHTLVTLAVSQATCGAYGEKFVYCSKCDFYEVQKINPTKHIDADNNTVCDVCGKLLKEICKHNWVVQYVRDTCGTEGICHVRCSECHAGKAVSVDYTEHCGVTYISGYKPSTVGSEGYSGDIYCLLCDKMIFKGKTTGKLVDPEIIEYRTECIDKLQNLLDSAKHETSVQILENAIESIRNLDEKAAITEKYNSAVAEYDYYEELLSSAVTKAIEEIENAAGENRSDVINFIVSETEKNINSAVSEIVVNEAKNEGLNSIKTQLAKEAETALKIAKAAAKSEISNAMTTVKCSDSYQILVVALKGIDTQKTVEDVEKTKNNALSFVAGLEKQLENAVSEANAAIENAAGESRSEAMQQIVNSAKAAVDKAASCDAVDNAKKNGLDAIEAQKMLEKEIAAKVLAEAKAAAIAEINNAKTEVNKAIAEKAVADINSATSVNAVTTIKTKALSDMAKADADAAAAKALAEAKTAAIAEITALLNDDSTDAEKALVNEAVEAVNNADSIQAVENAKSDFYAKWKSLHNTDDPTDPEDPSKTCDHICHKTGFLGFIWKIAKFFCKLFGTNKICSCGVKHY